MKTIILNFHGWIITTRPCGLAGIIPSLTASLLICMSTSWAQSTEVERIAISRNAIGIIVSDRHVPDSALDVHRRAMSMPAQQRYEYLSEWVLPGVGHDSIRLALDFTPTHPAPPINLHESMDAARIQVAKQRGETRVQTGGNLISPALDLIAVARELDRLDRVRTRIATAVPSSKRQERARLSLLAITDMAKGDFAAAIRDLDALYPLIEKSEERNFPGREPELLAIYAAQEHRQTRGFARDAAMHLLMRDVRTPNRGAQLAWEAQLAAMIAAMRHLDSQADESAASQWETEMSLAPRLTQWGPASRTTAATRGKGHARSNWRRANEEVENTNSHFQDFLYYHIPLQGNFQVECDLQTKDYQNSQLIVGGHWAEPLYYSLGTYQFGDLRSRLGTGNLEPMLTKYPNWAHLRIVVRDKVVTHYVNGRMLHRVEVRGDVDPWIVLKSDEFFDGSVKDIRITGDPVIPTEVRLTASEDLTGWFSYFPALVGTPNAAWQQLGNVAGGGGIVATGRKHLGEIHAERLLRYHRPMFEGGAIEYEFLYRKGATHVHPALDRLAFLLEPDGVRIHWVTDGEFDRTELNPDNVFDEPAERRGPKKLPLIENHWNRLRLTLEGDTVSLQLNDQLIYQRDLEITNQRTFGLFHYADRTEARVRDVRWHGHWPRELLPVAKQELANQEVELLDKRLPELTAVVKHDFARSGFPPEKVTINTTTGETIEHVPEGVRIVRPSGLGFVQTSLEFNLGIVGDFDVVAEYQGFDPRPGATGASNAGLRMLMSKVNSQQCILSRRFIRAPKQEGRNVAQAIGKNGTTAADLNWKLFHLDAHESPSGRIRLARRGGRVYYLIAEGDSPNFRLIGEAETTSDPLPRQCVQLFAQTEGDGQTQVIWKEAVIRAEQLSSYPSSVATLSVMNHDGTAIRNVLPKELVSAGLGSPAWSPDGKRIAFDIYRGSNANCHLYVANADGSNLRHVGIGNMPTFSPDGKRIAFSWGEGGITVEDIDGTNREVLDSNGWGAQWSPDGSVAFGRGGNIVVHDLKTKMQREVLEGDHALRYSYVYWNMGWSRDAKRICFQARTRQDDRYEIAVAATSGSQQEFQVLYSSPKEMKGDFSWHPDRNRILFCMEEGEGRRLFTLDCANPGPPVILPNHPPNHFISAADWSPDGKQILFVSQVLPDWEK